MIDTTKFLAIRSTDERWFTFIGKAFYEMKGFTITQVMQEPLKIQIDYGE